MQVLDEGRITDSHGRVVNFENTVIVMTSNAGSNKEGGSLGFGKTQNELIKDKAIKALKEFLRPEFISRLDEIIVFNKLTKDDFVKIAALMINEYVETLSERGIKLTYDESALKKLAEKSIGGTNGARDLRNLIRKEVEDKISTLIIKHDGFNIGNIHLTGEPELSLKLN